MNRAVIYARYSSHRQREQSIADQVAACKEYAEREGMTVVKIYTDSAKTGRNDDRAGFQEMLTDSDHKKFDTVLVWKTDRLGRDRYELAINKHRIRSNGAEIVSITENIPDTPEGALIEGITDAYAEYYSRNLSQNIRRGLRSNAKKGMVTGGITPDGLMIRDHKYVIDPDRAPVIKLIYDLFLEGYGIQEIIDTLDERGIKNKAGKKFTIHGINTILRNRRYMGEYKFQDIIIPDGIEPIIDKGDFFRCQELLATRRRHRRTNDGDQFLFTHKIECGICGNTYTVEEGTSHTGTVYKYYKCGTNKRKNGTRDCPSKPLRKDQLESVVIYDVLDKVLNQETIEGMAESIMALGEEDNTAVNAIKSQLKEEYRKQANLIKSIENGATSSAIISRLDEVEETIAELESKAAIEEIKKPRPTKDAVVFFLSDLKNEYRGDKTDYQRLVNKLISKIIINEEDIEIIFNSFMVTEHEGSTNNRMVGISKLKLNQFMIYDDYTFSYSIDLNSLPSLYC